MRHPIAPAARMKRTGPRGSCRGHSEFTSLQPLEAFHGQRPRRQGRSWVGLLRVRSQFRTPIPPHLLRIRSRLALRQLHEGGDARDPARGGGRHTPADPPRHRRSVRALALGRSLAVLEVPGLVTRYLPSGNSNRDLSTSRLAAAVVPTPTPMLHSTSSPSFRSRLG